MTDSAAVALPCCRNCERLNDSRRACISQNSVRARVKIFLHPGEILASLIPGSAVTTGGFAARRSNELATPNWRNFYFRCQTGWSESQGKRNQRQPAHNGSEHVLDGSGNRSRKPFKKRTRYCLLVVDDE